MEGVPFGSRDHVTIVELTMHFEEERDYLRRYEMVLSDLLNSKLPSSASSKAPIAIPNRKLLYTLLR